MRDARKHLSYLDGWRGCAILLLLFGHFNPVQMIAGHWIYTARLGVECFFVLSGRLMAELLFVDRSPIPIFYWRRFTRIFPALWLFVAVSFFTIPGIESRDAFLALAFSANYFPVHDSLGHLWSLCVEEHSYVLLSAIAILARSRRFNVGLLLGLMASAFAVNGLIQTIYLQRTYVDVYLHSDVRAASVFAGASLFLVLRSKSLPSWLPVLAALIGLFIGVYDRAPDVLKYTLGTFALALSVATIDRAPSWCRCVLSVAPLRLVGVWSFSLYLWQQPFYVVKGLSLVARLACVTLLSLVSYFVVENPMRKKLNAAWRPSAIRQHSNREPLFDAPSGAP